MGFLSGYRTYLVAIASVAGAVVLFIDGKVDFGQFLVTVGPAIAAVFARIGAKNDAK